MVKGWCDSQVPVWFLLITCAWLGVNHVLASCTTGNCKFMVDSTTTTHIKYPFTKVNEGGVVLLQLQGSVVGNMESTSSGNNEHSRGISLSDNGGVQTFEGVYILPSPASPVGVNNWKPLACGCDYGDNIEHTIYCPMPRVNTIGNDGDWEMPGVGGDGWARTMVNGNTWSDNYGTLAYNDIYLVVPVNTEATSINIDAAYYHGVTDSAPICSSSPACSFDVQQGLYMLFPRVWLDPELTDNNLRITSGTWVKVEAGNSGSAKVENVKIYVWGNDMSSTVFYHYPDGSETGICPIVDDVAICPHPDIDQNLGPVTDYAVFVGIDTSDIVSSLRMLDIRFACGADGFDYSEYSSLPLLPAEASAPALPSDPEDDYDPQQMPYYGLCDYSCMSVLEPSGNGIYGGPLYLTWTISNPDNYSWPVANLILYLCWSNGCTSASDFFESVSDSDCSASDIDATVSCTHQEPLPGDGSTQTYQLSLMLKQDANANAPWNSALFHAYFEVTTGASNSIQVFVGPLSLQAGVFETSFDIFEMPGNIETDATVTINIELGNSDDAEFTGKLRISSIDEIIDQGEAVQVEVDGADPTGCSTSGDAILCDVSIDADKSAIPVSVTFTLTRFSSVEKDLASMQWEVLDSSDETVLVLSPPSTTVEHVLYLDIQSEFPEIVVGEVAEIQLGVDTSRSTTITNAQIVIAKAAVELGNSIQNVKWKELSDTGDPVDCSVGETLICDIGTIRAEGERTITIFFVVIEDFNVDGVEITMSDVDSADISPAKTLSSGVVLQPFISYLEVQPSAVYGEAIYVDAYIISAAAPSSTTSITLRPINGFDLDDLIDNVHIQDIGASKRVLVECTKASDAYQCNVDPIPNGGISVTEVVTLWVALKFSPTSPTNDLSQIFLTVDEPDWQYTRPHLSLADISPATAISTGVHVSSWTLDPFEFSPAELVALQDLTVVMRLANSEAGTCTSTTLIIDDTDDIIADSQVFVKVPYDGQSVECSAFEELSLCEIGSVCSDSSIDVSVTFSTVVSDAEAVFLDLSEDLTWAVVSGATAAAPLTYRSGKESRKFAGPVTYKSVALKSISRFGFYGGNDGVAVKGEPLFYSIVIAGTVSSETTVGLTIDDSTDQILILDGVVKAAVCEDMASPDCVWQDCSEVSDVYTCSWVMLVETEVIMLKLLPSGDVENLKISAEATDIDHPVTATDVPPVLVDDSGGVYWGYDGDPEATAAMTFAWDQDYEWLGGEVVRVQVFIGNSKGTQVTQMVAYLDDVPSKIATTPDVFVPLILDSDGETELCQFSRDSNLRSKCSFEKTIDAASEDSIWLTFRLATAKTSSGGSWYLDDIKLTIQEEGSGVLSQIFPSHRWKQLFGPVRRGHFISSGGSSTDDYHFTSDKSEVYSGEKVTWTFGISSTGGFSDSADSEYDSTWILITPSSALFDVSPTNVPKIQEVGSTASAVCENVAAQWKCYLPTPVEIPSHSAVSPGLTYAEHWYTVSTWVKDTDETDGTTYGRVCWLFASDDEFKCSQALTHTLTVGSKRMVVTHTPFIINTNVATLGSYLDVLVRVATPDGSSDTPTILVTEQDNSKFIGAAEWRAYSLDTFTTCPNLECSIGSSISSGEYVVRAHLLTGPGLRSTLRRLRMGFAVKGLADQSSSWVYTDTIEVRSPRTNIYVSLSSVEPNDGTFASPYRTIHMAVLEAGDGDTVVLTSGEGVFDGESLWSKYSGTESHSWEWHPIPGANRTVYITTDGGEVEINCGGKKLRRSSSLRLVLSSSVRLSHCIMDGQVAISI